MSDLGQTCSYQKVQSNGKMKDYFNTLKVPKKMSLEMKEDTESQSTNKLQKLKLKSVNSNVNDLYNQDEDNIIPVYPWWLAHPRETKFHNYK